MSRVLLATIASIAGSLAADALLVAIGQAVFPSTRGCVHFQFADYAKLAVIGVIFACVGWPIVTRVSRDPRWAWAGRSAGWRGTRTAPEPLPAAPWEAVTCGPWEAPLPVAPGEQGGDGYGGEQEGQVGDRQVEQAHGGGAL
jgi:hypothetical protein